MALYAEETPRTWWRPKTVADLVPWRAVLAPGVILQKQAHGLQRSYLMRGPDVQGESREVQGTYMLQANEVFKRLGGQWMMQTEAQRVRVTSLPAPGWTHPIARLINEEQRTALLLAPGSRETTYYLTLSWRPPDAFARAWGGFFLRGPGAPDGPGEAEAQALSLREFVTQADYLVDLLRGMLAVCRPLTTEETLTYLHACVSDRWHRVGRLAALVDIDAQICDTPLTGGWYPQLGTWHLRTCSVLGYPAQSTVGIMRALAAADCDYRWCTQWIGQDKHAQGKALHKVQSDWVGHERSFMARIAESLSNRPSRILN